MNRNGQLIPLLFGLYLVTVSTISWGQQPIQPSLSYTIETQALNPASQSTLHRPEFTLKDMTGLPHKLSEWDGHIIVLNFWATWCRPCLTEIPMFNDVQQQLADNNVVFIGIAIDDLATVQAFQARTNIAIDYLVLIGDDDAIPIAIDYGNESGILPYTVIIDANGTITFQHFGTISRKQLVMEINSAIKRPVIH